MQRIWTETELQANWSLRQDELVLVGKYRGPNRLRCAALLKYFQLEGQFPKTFIDIPLQGVKWLSKSLEIASENIASSYDYLDATSKRQRRDIREFLGVRRCEKTDYDAAQRWLAENINSISDGEDTLYEHVSAWFKRNKIELPPAQQLDRIVNSALVSFEERRFRRVSARLLDHSKRALDRLFIPKSGEGMDGTTAPFSLLKAESGRPSLKSVFTELAKLAEIDALNLPAGLFDDVPSKLLHNYRSRAGTESIRDMRRHPAPIRYTLAAAFCHERRQEIIDSLIELLIQIVHVIRVRAEKKVIKELVSSIREISGKKTVLFKMAEAAIENPDGTIREVLFPVVGEDILRELVKEYYANSPIYTEKVETSVRNSYKSHYRRMVPSILEALEFQSSNQYHQPVIKALDYLKAQAPKQRNIMVQDAPVDEIVPKSLRPLLIQENARGRQYIDRISYEICVLRALRDGLRCREIWVNGADRYRNPDEDLPQDFEEKRECYYRDLSLPLAAEEFIDSLRERMRAALSAFNESLPKSPKVSLRRHGKNVIKLSPLEAQPEPKFLQHLKAGVSAQWPMTSLLDIVKEADFQIEFTDEFRGLGDREILGRGSLKRRLLLCLYALGTNTGLKRVLAGGNELTYEELRYVKERYIHKDGLKAAIAKVVNATLKIRQSSLWGEGTTGCASDSKKIQAWDQNLMTEWHIRYRGRGVMVYWHVEKNSLCIYSQLKRCSSSEVGSMIEGVMRHCTEMQIDKQYVDSHGQSEVAFAFCDLLGFSLMPRLKAIARQKLYLSEAGEQKLYPNLTPILTRPINWALIGQQYDQMVKYAAALQKGTAHADAILRRFTRNNLQHPTYQALSELGRAVKTIFLCQYLESEALRQEIQEALNVVENCNSTVDFIFFARNSELASNEFSTQEISVLALHLLQACLVYVNTLMIQQVLKEKNWIDRMLEEDFRALTPLIYSHVTPYGSFKLDMNKRLFPETVAI